MSTHHVIAKCPRPMKMLVTDDDGTRYIKRMDTPYKSLRQLKKELKLRQKAAKEAKKNDKDASKTIDMECKPIDSTKMEAESKQQQQAERPVK